MPPAHSRYSPMSHEALARQQLLDADALIAEGDHRFGAKEFAAAIPLYSQALELRIAALGEQHAIVAIALNRLANVYYQENDDAAAAALFERALAIREAILAADAPELRLSVNNLANTYRNLGRFAEAEPLYRRSLRIREQETGHADHPALWRNPVRVLESQGKNEEATEYNERLLISRTHPDSSSSRRMK